LFFCKAQLWHKANWQSLFLCSILHQTYHPVFTFTTIGKTRKTTSASAHRVEHLTQRLIFQLHITRYRGILDQK
jgi:hypothetical protein